MSTLENDYRKAAQLAKRVGGNFDSVRDYMLQQRKEVIDHGLRLDSPQLVRRAFRRVVPMRITDTAVNEVMQIVWNNHDDTPNTGDIAVVTGVGILHVRDDDFDNSYTEVLGSYKSLIIGRVGGVGIRSYRQDGQAQIFSQIADSLQHHTTTEQREHQLDVFDSVEAGPHDVRMDLVLYMNRTVRIDRPNKRLIPIEGTVYVPLRYQHLDITTINPDGLNDGE
jgi:hypothetical protein